jgi:hypothetical protein
MVDNALAVTDIVGHDFDFVANQTCGETELAPKRDAVECQTDNQGKWNMPV